MIACIRTFTVALTTSLLFATSVIAGEAGDLEAGISAYRDKNFQATIEKILPLAILGNAEAQYIISRMYLFGEGFPEDHCASAIWVEKAARQGHAYAAVAMSFAYRGGGIIHNDEMAYRWMAYGHKQGHPDVLENINFLAQYITPEKRAEIDKNIKTWDPSKLPSPEFFPVSRNVLENVEFRFLLRQTYGISGCTLE